MRVFDHEQYVCTTSPDGLRKAQGVLTNESQNDIGRTMCHG